MLGSNPDSGAAAADHIAWTLSLREISMQKLAWFAVDNSIGKRIPEWRRSFGVDDDGTVYVPAAMAGVETELNVLLCAQDAGQRSAVHLDHHFVPTTWLKQEYPKHLELIEIIEKRASEATEVASL